MHRASSRTLTSTFTQLDQAFSMLHSADRQNEAEPRRINLSLRRRQTQPAQHEHQQHQQQLSLRSDHAHDEEGPELLLQVDHCLKLGIRNNLGACSTAVLPGHIPLRTVSWGMGHYRYNYVLS